jgi:hypothetical protein
VNLVGPAFLIMNSLAAATLLVAGASKVVVPQPLRRALHELTPRHAGIVSVGVVRAFAVAEVVIAFGVLLPWARVVAGVGLGVLGATVMVAGVAGHLGRSSVPCGCLGGGNHALGLRNVLVGAVFVGVAAINVTTVPPDPGLWTAAPLAAAAATVVLCVWTHRMITWRLLRARPISGTQ